MLPTNCQTVTDVSLIKFEEKGKTAIFQNKTRETYIRTKIDGCLIKHGRRCDWMLSKSGVGDIAIELKGCDVKHAIGQIEATIRFLRENKLNQKKLGALIVCSQYPRVSTRIQVAQDSLAKRFATPLHIRTNAIECTFDKLLEFGY